MNKEKFIKELNNKTNYGIEKCTLINDILEDNFLIGKKNKEKIILDLTQKADFDSKEAEKVYETCLDIIGSELKNKIKHPFK